MTKSNGVGGVEMGETYSNRNAEEMQHKIFTRNPEGTRLPRMLVRRGRVRSSPVSYSGNTEFKAWSS